MKPSKHPTLLTSKELAKRWGINPGTLANWRVFGNGPRFIKLGWAVVYPLDAVEAYEKKHGKGKAA